MRLLFDENLAPRLVRRLADVYADPAHVRDVGLARAEDADVWSMPVLTGLQSSPRTLTSSNQQRSFVEDHPPKVIWFRLGNCSTADTRDIERLLRDRQQEVVAFGADADGPFLILS